MSTPNSIDALLTQQSAAQAPPPSASSSAQPNSIDSLLGGSSPVPSTVQTPQESARSGNTIDAMLGQTSANAAAPSGTVDDPNAPWYSKTWDWLNKPLFDLHREGAGGFETGVEDVLTNLTSPLSIGLTVGTLGSDTALEALGLAAKDLPVAVQGIKALTDAGFTGQAVYGLAQQSPQFLDALKTGDYETAKRLAVNMTVGGIGAALGTNQGVKDAGILAERAGIVKPNAELSAVRTEFGKYQADRTGNGIEAKNLEEAARKELGKADDVTKGAIMRYIEAGGDDALLASRKAALEVSPEVQSQYTAKERQALLDKYEKARNLTPEQQKVANGIRESLEQDLELGYQNDLVRAAVENYVSHFWKPEDNVPSANKLKFQANNGAFDTNVSFAKKRVFGSAFDGELLGRKLANDDPIALMANYRFKIKNAIASRDFLERLRDTNARASDGRPLVALSGTGKVLGEESGSPVVFVNPKQMRSIRIPENVWYDMQQNGILQDFIDSGKIRSLGVDKNEIPKYGWNTGDYQVIDHPAFRDWNYVTGDTQDNPVFMKGELRAHPEVTQFLRRAIGAEKSVIRNSAIGRAALSASTEGKHLLLSFSPFHIVQEGLRAVMSGISPFGKFDVPNLEADPKLRFGVENGLTLGRDYRGLDDFTEGVGGSSHIINKIPGLRNIQNGIQSFLFDQYIPGLKVRAYKSLFDRYREANPASAVEDVAKMAAEHTNEVFGGLNYGQMGRSTTSQDLFRLSALAPDWMESELRFLKRAISPGGGIARQDMARIAAYTFAASRVLNYLVSGQAHLEAPFGVVVPGQKGQDDKVYSFRTLPTDLVHAVSDPRGFIQGRVNPLTVRTGIEGLTGRDDYGRKVTPATELGDFAKNLAPIPTQSQLKRMMGQVTDLSNSEQVAKALGASVYSYRTEAEKIAQERASDRTPTGPVDQRQLANHLRNIQLEDSLRGGAIRKGQVMHELPKRDADTVIENATLTPLQARFKRLPMQDALDVWDVATPPEKQQLHKMLWEKRMNYMKANPPKWRNSDPTWTRLKRVFPDLQ